MARSLEAMIEFNPKPETEDAESQRIPSLTTLALSIMIEPTSLDRTTGCGGCGSSTVLGILCGSLSTAVKWKHGCGSSLEKSAAMADDSAEWMTARVKREYPPEACNPRATAILLYLGRRPRAMNLSLQLYG